jgi:hypothetical protein
MKIAYQCKVQGGMDSLAQDRDRWRALVNTVPERLRYLLHCRKVVIVQFVTAPVRLVRRLCENIGLGSWVPLPVKVKMDGAVVYEFGSVSEQSVHEVVSRIYGMQLIQRLTC